MAETLWLPPPQKDLAAGKRQFVELYGSIRVMNTYLKIALDPGGRLRRADHPSRIADAKRLALGR